MSSDSAKEQLRLGVKKVVADANAKSIRDVNHIRDLSWAQGRKRNLIDKLDFKRAQKGAGDLKSTLEGVGKNLNKTNPVNLTKAGKIGLGVAGSAALAGAAGYLGHRAYKKYKDSKKETK